MAPEPSDVQQAEHSAAAEIGDAVYGGSYFAANPVAVRSRPALSQDIDVDVCVIGAGLAGLTVARELARKGWSVAVLEAKRVAWNASGRNTGFVLPGFAQDPETIVERVGLEAARELWALSQQGADYIRTTITEGRIEGLDWSDGWLHISKTDRSQSLRDRTELLRNLGADVEFWPEKLVRTKIKSDSYFQAVHHPTAFSLHPLNYALGLAGLAEQAGARIFEQTSAISIDPAGVRKRITTANGRVRAAHIVLAGNTHIGRLTPSLSTTLVPIHTFVIVTKALGSELGETIDYRGAVSDTDGADNHYRIIGGDRLMWAGRMTVWDAKPARFGRRLRRDLRLRFPSLQDAEVDYAWTGEIGMTVHRMPQIGEVSPGVWLANGFAGHGLNTTAMAATLIARAIMEGDDRWRQFQPFELVWAGGRTGRIVVQGAYWGRRQYDELASRWSRMNEMRRIRMEPILAKRAERAEERAKLYAARQEQEAIARSERVRVAREKRDKAIAERARIAAERAEARRIRDEQRAIERAARQAEKDRLAAEKLEAKRLEAERLASEQAAAERARLEAARAEAARAEAERVEAERVEAAQIEAARIEAERFAAEASAQVAGATESAEKVGTEIAAIRPDDQPAPENEPASDKAKKKRGRRS